MATGKGAMPQNNAEQRLAKTGLRIICIAMCTDDNNQCVYRVYTSDGGYNIYTGYKSVPAWVREWMEQRNTWEHVIPSCMLVSGVSLV